MTWRFRRPFNAFTPGNALSPAKFQKKKKKNANFIFENAWKQIASCESTAKKVPFEFLASQKNFVHRVTQKEWELICNTTPSFTLSKRAKGRNMCSHLPYVCSRQKPATLSWRTNKTCLTKLLLNVFNPWGDWGWLVSSRIKKPFCCRSVIKEERKLITPIKLRKCTERRKWPAEMDR